MPIIADVPPASHPGWCERGRVCLDGVHRSRPYTATTSDTSHPMRIWLEQTHQPVAGATVVVLEVVDLGDPRYFTLPVGQARVLRFQLARAIDAAKGGQR